MAERKDPQEPSMEEILGTIRRIIAEDEDTGRPLARGAAAAPAREERDEEEELELTDMVTRPTAPVSSPAIAAPTASPSPQPQTTERSSMAAQEESSLLSRSTAEATTAALARLAKAAAGGDDRPAIPGGGRTVEELVIELLRPQLKEWLDQHLPAIVERVVEQEVKKLARRAELL